MVAGLLRLGGFEPGFPVVRVSALGALNGEEKWEKSVDELMDKVDEYIPHAGARHRQAVPDAD